METPIHLHKRRTIFNNVTNSSPRRSLLMGSPAIQLADADEERERSFRREQAGIHRRLSHISTSTSHSPLNEANLPADSDVKEHYNLCLKLYTENRINAKNVWKLQVFDAIGRLSKIEGENVFQFATTSLDVGAKVYACRVDDVHAKGFELANAMGQLKGTERSNNNDNDTSSIEEDTPTKMRKRKIKHFFANKKKILEKEESLLNRIERIDLDFFRTREKSNTFSIANLLSNKLPTCPATDEFVFLGDKKWLEHGPDQSLTNGSEVLDFQWPECRGSLCSAFNDFEIGFWDINDPGEDYEHSASQPLGPVLDDDGCPIPELDGSIHDMFGNDPADGDDDDEEIEEHHQDVFQVQLHGEVAHIVDAIPDARRLSTDYGYSALVRSASGKYIDRIWAGPAHWKVKFIKRSAPRFSGTSATTLNPKKLRPKKVLEPIDMSKLDEDDDFEGLGRFVKKRAPPTSTYEKVTLPMPQMKSWQSIMASLFSKKKHPRPILKSEIIDRTPTDDDNGDVQGYNYENPNDSMYCSQNQNDDHDEPGMDNNSDQETPWNDRLVDEPALVTVSNIPYALHAKRMDMKKLKITIWDILAQHKNTTTFSLVYKTISQCLPLEMAEELSPSLAIVALLHLCNEHNLALNTKDNDFIISQA